MLKSQSFLAVLIQTYSSFNISKYRCVFLIQNCYLQVPALSMDLLKEFDVLIDFLSKEFAFHDLDQGGFNFDVLVEDDLQGFCFCVICSMKTQAQWKLRLPLLQQNSILLELNLIDVPRQSLQCYINIRIQFHLRVFITLYLSLQQDLVGLYLRVIFKIILTNMFANLL